MLYNIANVVPNFVQIYNFCEHFVQICEVRFLSKGLNFTV